jgi:hypothetical protein
VKMMRSTGAGLTGSDGGTTVVEVISLRGGRFVGSR